jgi:hypothetical protein
MYTACTICRTCTVHIVRMYCVFLRLRSRLLASKPKIYAYRFKLPTLRLDFLYTSLRSLYSYLNFPFPGLNFLYLDLSFLLPCGSQQHQTDRVTHLNELSPFWRTNSSPWPPSLFKHNMVLVTTVGDSILLKDLLQAAYENGHKRSHGSTKAWSPK